MSKLLDRCRECLRYEPQTGYFYWLKCPNNRGMIGKRAGYISTKGYRQIKLDGRAYMANRLAWLMMTGAMPRRQVDHRNEVKDDNRWDNLRPATDQTNRLFVAKPNANNKNSGVRGVYENHGKWRAMIRLNGRLLCLGNYAEKSVASEAYRFAKESFLGDQPSQI
jgi:hypothetical protein